MTAGSPSGGAGVVVVGGGQAGFQVAASLRENGFRGAVTLVGEEPCFPYQRPPLSKAYLAGGVDAAGLVLRPAGHYAEQRIAMRVGERAAAVDRAARDVVLDSGERLAYDHLVLAVGARDRVLPVPGAELAGVTSLRTLQDAETLRGLLRPQARLVVVGGGFIGMEVAAAATSRGMDVTVVEALGRVMPRAVTPELSAHVVAHHRARGARILVGRSVWAVVGADRVEGVELDDGEVLPADVVVVGIGVVPNVELAAGAGLPVDDGIVVDEHLVTADPRVSAIGDCASYPSLHGRRRLRVESVQNGVDHARHVAARLCGRSAGPYAAVPWFWTHQLDMRIQLAGIGSDHDEAVVLGDPGTGRFSVLRFDDGALVSVESVNRAADHMAARRILAAGARAPSVADVRRPGFSLKAFAATSSPDPPPGADRGADSSEARAGALG